MKLELSDDAIQARREYNRNYYHTHKKQRRKSQRKYWEKRAKQKLLMATSVEDVCDDPNEGD